MLVNGQGTIVDGSEGIQAFFNPRFDNGIFVKNVDKMIFVKLKDYYLFLNLTAVGVSNHINNRPSLNFLCYF